MTTYPTTPQWPTNGAPTTGQQPSPNLISLVNFYVARLIVQYGAKPRAQQTIAILLKQALADDMGTLILNAFNLDTAVGAQLDTIGKYVGLPRNIGSGTAPNTFGLVTPPSFTNPPNNPTGFLNPITGDNAGAVFFPTLGPGDSNLALSDESYRFMLKLKIADNVSDGRLSSIQQLLQTLFQGTVTVTDNQNMTVTYAVAENAPVTSALLMAYLPKPMGVGISVVSSGVVFTRVTSDGATRVTSDGSSRTGTTL